MMKGKDSDHMANYKPSVDRDKYKLKIVRPDLQYLLMHSDGNLVNQSKDGILKVQNESELERVLAKMYYGKWYVPADKWNKLKKKGVKD